MSKIRVASFFAGAGGLDLGFANNRFEVVYATDIDHDCCKTLELNRGSVVHSEARIVQADITQLALEDLPNNIDLVVGGPPCQSFSASGRRAGGAAGRLDDRGNLFEAYRDIIAYLAPKAFLFENVRGIFATNKGKDWLDILAAFAKIGYHLDYRILDAADYGVPQHRERVFLVGHRLNHPFLFPRPLFGPDSVNGLRHVSPREAFSSVVIKDEERQLLNFEGGKYSHLLPEIPEGHNYLFFTAKRGHPRPIFAYRSRFSDFLYKAHPDYPMKTIIASPGKYTGPLHWENRYFSIGEYMAIQGFPQGYRFFGDRASVIKQIGNSVCPKVAASMGEAILDQIFEGRFNVDYLKPDEVLSFDDRKAHKASATKKLHAQIILEERHRFTIEPRKMLLKYRTDPAEYPADASNTTCKVNGDLHRISVSDFEEAQLSAKVCVDFWSLPRDFQNPAIARVEVKLFGASFRSPQLIWNALDEWVRRVSSFNSLFELYGHFTEPYPYFRVSDFEIYEDSPWLEFAKVASDDTRCSRYLNKEELVTQFGRITGLSDFDMLAGQLRRMRYDVRTRETNIAIPEGKYMIAYPFTLPEAKQMNFSIKQPVSKRSGESYITAKRMVHQ